MCDSGTQRIATRLTTFISVLKYKLVFVLGKFEYRLNIVSASTKFYNSTNRP